jgi:hypothetical protein
LLGLLVKKVTDKCGRLVDCSRQFCRLIDKDIYVVGDLGLDLGSEDGGRYRPDFAVEFGNVLDRFCCAGQGRAFPGRYQPGSD